MKKLTSLILAILMSFAFCVAGRIPVSADENAEIEYIMLSQTEVVQPGDYIDVRAEIYPENADTSNLEWTVTGNAIDIQNIGENKKYCEIKTAQSQTGSVKIEVRDGSNGVSALEI